MVKQNFHRVPAQAGRTPTQRHGSRRSRYVGLALLPLAAAVQTLLWAAPQGGQVVGGQGSISRPDALSTRVDQGSHSLAIEWSSFNLAPAERVQFVQPGAESVVLNRILDQNPSQIFGTIQANGRVFLSNPNGLFFAPGARINVGALVAAGMDMDPQAFMAGNYRFAADGDGIVVNRGLIQAATGGDVALIGRQVSNEGLILADYGRVELGAGERVRVDFTGDGLISIESDPGLLDEALLNDAPPGGAAVNNSGHIRAEGGQVLLRADTARSVFDRAVNNSGIIEAGRIDNSGGQIRLVGLGGYVESSGLIDAGGRGAGDHGGRVEILGDGVALTGQAVVDASGPAGGGQVLIGGDYQGANPEVANARVAFLGSEAVVRADATAAGDGGRVILWADDTTRFHGAISARGGDQGGDGGFVETSGKRYLEALGRVDAGGPLGAPGEWLLDPTDINIVSAAGGGDNPITGAGPTGGLILFSSGSNNAVVTTAAIVTALGTANVTISTDSSRGDAGNVVQEAGADIAYAGANERTFSIHASGNITLGASISSINAALNVVFDANATDSIGTDPNLAVGSVAVNGGISTNGGDFTVTGVGLTTGASGGISTGAGITNVTVTGDAALVASTGNLNLGQVQAGGSVSLTATAGSILDADTAANADNDIVAESIVLSAGASIGASGAGNELDINSDANGVAPAGSVTATATNGSIFLNETSGDLNLNTLSANATSGSVGASAAGSIVDANNDGAANITANSITLTAAGGSVGETADRLEIDSGTGLVSATASSGSVFLTETAGAMNLGSISANATTGTAALTAATSIVDGNNNAAANITANSITLAATAGDIGETADRLEINSGTGLVSAAANGSIFLTETAGSISLGTLTANATTGSLALSAAAGILDGNNDGNANLTANSIDLATTSGDIGEFADRLEIESGTGLVSASASGGSILLSELTGALNLGTLTANATTGSAVLVAATDILDGNNNGTANITANAMNLTATAGSIGEAADPLEINSGTGLVAALATTGSVFLTETAGALNLASVTANAATGTVALTAATDILDGNNNASANVTGNAISLTATSGNLGETGDRLEINSGTGLVSASATAGSIFLSETVGALNLGTISANATTGTVALTAATSIFDGNNNAAANISANAIDLVATAGDLGEAADALEIDSGAGLVGAAATAGSVFLTETAGTLNLDSVSANAATGTASLAAAGGIVDGNNDGSANVSANTINLAATTGDLGEAADALEIDSGAGLVSASASGGSIYLTETTGALSLASVAANATTGAVVLSAATSILDGNNDANANISGNAINLSAATGDLGEVADALEIDSGSGLVSASAGSGSVFLTETAGAMNLATVTADATTGTVVLRAATSILDGNNDANANISANTINLTATTGDLGEAADALEIDSGAGLLNASANGGSIYLTETTGALSLASVTANASTGTVALSAATSILDGNNDANANISGNAITLTAANGDVGEAADALEIDSGTGLVSASASSGSVFLTETAGAMNLGTVTADAATGTVTLIAASAILDGNNDANANVTANTINLTANGGDIGALANRLEINSGAAAVTATAGAGSVYLTETADALNLNRISANAATGVVALTAATAIVDANNDANANIIANAVDLTASAGDIGALANRLEIDSGAGTVSATAASGSVFLSETAGALNLASVTANAASGTVALTAATDLLDGNNDGNANINANAIDLVAGTGDIGAAANPLEIDSGDGLVSATATSGSVFLTETAGAMNLDRVAANAAGSVALSAATAILDGNNDAAADVSAASLRLDAASIGAAANPLDVRVADLNLTVGGRFDIAVVDAGVAPAALSSLSLDTDAGFDPASTLAASNIGRFNSAIGADGLTLSDILAGSAAGGASLDLSWTHQQALLLGLVDIGDGTLSLQSQTAGISDATAGADAVVDLSAANIVLSAPAVIGADGNPIDIRLNAPIGGLSASSGESLFINSPGGGDLVVGGLTATNRVVLSGGGALRDANSGINDLVTDITAGRVELFLTGAIGQSGDSLDVDTGDLVIGSTSERFNGSAFIDLRNGATLSDLDRLSLATGSVGAAVQYQLLAQGLGLNATRASALLTLGSVVESNPAASLALAWDHDGSIDLGLINVGDGQIGLVAGGAIQDAANDNLPGPPVVDLVAADISLAAGTGIGSVRAVELTTPSLNATTGAGDINLNSLASATLTASLLRVGDAGNANATLDSGSISLAQSGNRNLVITEASTENGAITLSNTGGTLNADTLDAGGSVSLVNTGGSLSAGQVTASGAISLDNTSGSLSLGNASAGTNLTLITRTGGDVTLDSIAAANQVLITSAGAIDESDPGDAAVDISAADITLAATTGIGALRDIELTTPVLSATTIGGNIDLNSLAAATLSASQLRVTAGAGDISLVQTGDQALNVVAASTQNGSITLDNSGAGLSVGTASANGGDLDLVTRTLGDLRLNTLSAGNAVNIISAGAIDETAPDDPAVDISAASISLTAASGIGLDSGLDANAGIELSTTSLNATTGTGGVRLRSLAGAGVSVTDLSVSGGAGDISLVQTGGQALSVLSATTQDGHITLDNTDGTLAAGAINAAGAGRDVSLVTRNSGTIEVDAVSAADQVMVTAAGAIEEAPAGDPDADITASGVSLAAATGIGAIRDIELTTATLSATSTGGSITLNSLANTGVTVSTLSVATAPGDISLVQTGNQTLSILSASTQGGNIALDNTGARLSVESASAGGPGSDLSLTTRSSGDIELAGISATDRVTISAAGAIDETGAGDAGADITAAVIALDAAGGIGAVSDLELTAPALSATTLAGNIDLNSLAPAAVTVADLSVTTGPGDISLVQTGGLGLTLTSASTQNGSITLDNSSAQLSVGSASANGGDLNLTTRNSGDVRFDALSAGNAVNIVSAGAIDESAPDDATVDIDAAGINLVAASGIGQNSGAGVDAGIELSGTSLSATTLGGGISLRSLAAAGMTVSDLSVSAAAGNISLVQTGNQTLTVNSASTQNGSILLDNTGADLVGLDVLGNGAVSLVTQGSGRIAAGNLVSSSAVSIVAAGDIEEAAPGDASADITAPVTDLQAIGGGIGTAVNPLEIDVAELSLADAGNGGVFLAHNGSGASLDLRLTQASATADISIESGSGSLRVTSVSAGGSATLDAAGAIIDANATAGAADVSGDTVNLSAAAGDIGAAGDALEIDTGAGLGLVSADAGSVYLDGVNGDLVIGEVRAANNAQLRAAAGANLLDDGDDATRVGAASVSLTAAGGAIGEAAGTGNGRLDLATGDLDFAALAGVFVDNQSSGVADLTAGGTTGGNLQLATDDNLLIGLVSGGNLFELFSTSGSINDADSLDTTTADVNAAEVRFDAGTGVGNLADLEVRATNLSATSNSGALALRSLANGAVTADSLTVDTGSGGISLIQTGNQALTVSNASTVDGAIILRNTGDNAVDRLTLGQVSAGGSRAVEITSIGAGDIVVGNVSAAGGSISLTSPGAIDDNAGDAETSADLSADSLTLSAVSGIGAALALETAARSLSAITTNGAIRLGNTTASAATVSQMTTGVGSIEFSQSGSNLTLSSVSASNGTVTLANDTGDIAVGLVSATGNTISMDVAGAITEADAVDNLDLRAASLDLQAGRGMDLDTEAVNLNAATTTGNLLLSNSAVVDVNVTGLRVGDPGNANGAVDAGAIGFTQLGGRNVDLGGASTEDGAIALNLAQLAINGPVTADGNQVSITDSAGAGMGVGAASGFNLLLNQTEIGNITAGSLLLTTSGDMRVVGLSGGTDNLGELILRAANIAFEAVPGGSDGAVVTRDLVVQTNSIGGNINIGASVRSNAGSLTLDAGSTGRVIFDAVAASPLPLSVGSDQVFTLIAERMVLNRDTEFATQSRIIDLSGVSIVGNDPNPSNLTVRALEEVRLGPVGVIAGETGNEVDSVTVDVGNAGSIVLSGDILTDNVGGIDFSSAGSVDLNASSITLDTSAGSGTVNFGDATNGTADISGANTDLRINAGGNVSLGAVTADSFVIVTNNSNIDVTLAGNVTTDGTAADGVTGIDFGSVANLLLTGDTTLDAGVGDINLAGVSGAAGLTLASNGTTRLADDIVVDGLLDLGGAALVELNATTVRLDAGSGDVSLGAVSGGGNSLTLVGGIANIGGDLQDLGTLNALSVDSLNLTNNTLIEANQFTLGTVSSNATPITGNVALTLALGGGTSSLGAIGTDAVPLESLEIDGGTVRLFGDVITAGAMDLSGVSSLNLGSNISLTTRNANGNITFSPTGLVSGQNALTIEAGGTANLGSMGSSTDPLRSLTVTARGVQIGSIATAGTAILTQGAISFAASPVNLSGEIRLDSNGNNAGGAINLGSGIDGPGGLTLASGIGAIILGPVGQTTALAHLTIENAGQALAVGVGNANGELVAAITTSGGLDLGGAPLITLDPTTLLQIDGGAGTQRLADIGTGTGGGVPFAGVTLNGTGTTHLSGRILTGAGGIDLSGVASAVLDSAVTLDTSAGAGAVLLTGGGIDGPGALSINSAAGAVTLGNLGQGAAIGTLTVTSLGALDTQGDIASSGNINLAANALTQRGALLTSGAGATIDVTVNDLVAGTAGINMSRDALTRSAGGAIHYTASTGSILLSQIDAGSGRIELDAPNGNILNNTGADPLLSLTRPNLVGGNADLTAGNAIGASSEDPVSLSIENSGLIALSFGAPQAFISNLRGTNILNRTGNRVIDVLAERRAAASRSQGTSLLPVGDAPRPDPQLSSTDLFNVLDPDSTVELPGERGEVVITSRIPAVPPYIRTLQGWEFRRAKVAAPEAQPEEEEKTSPKGSQRRQERNIEWLREGFKYSVPKQ